MNETPASSLPLPSEPRLQALLLAVLTCTVFAPTLSSGFVYDARLQILTDPFLHDPRNWLPVLTFGTLSMDVLDFNRPVNLASLMLDAAIWGREPFGYHLTSVLVHAANVVLLWAVLRRMAPGMPRTAAVAAPLLFAVHPVVTEAVCEPTFREDLLVTSFTLAGLLLALGHRPPSDRHDGWRTLGCAACAVLAIGSKESGIAAPAVLAACWLLVRREDRGWFWPLAVGGASLAVLAFLTARFTLEPAPSMIFESRPQYPGGSLPAALPIEARILALYVQQLLLPVNLCADYGLHSVAHLPLPVAGLVVAAVITVAAAAVRADLRMAVPVAMVVGALLPVSNIVPIYRAAADRYLYLPMAGVALAAGLLLDAPWLGSRAELRERLAVACLSVAVLFGVACNERQKVWADPLPLWSDTFRRNPLSFTAASGLADALRGAGRLEEAERVARQAIELSGGQRGDAWVELSLVLEARGRIDEAFAALDKAVALDPRLADPEGRVAVLAMERTTAEALERLQTRRNAAR